MSMELLKRSCEKYDVMSDEVFLSKSGKTSSDGRFRFRYTKPKGLALFAIKYFEENQLYIVWNLNAPKAQKKLDFSVSVSAVYKHFDDGKINFINKNVEYSGWNEETVIAFKPAMMDTFILEYIKEQRHV